MIAVDNLTKSYVVGDKRHYVFRNVSFSFPAKTNIGIMGPNGAGKSTLLRILGGIDHPDSGQIRRDVSISWPLGLRGGFVSHMTGRENCRMVCNAYGIGGGELKRKIEEIKDLSGIGYYFEQPVGYYSSGMGGRLGFALSMAFDFDYFLIDEITSVGDAHFRKMAKDTLDDKRAKSNIIMVSHSMGDLKRFCDVAVLIRDGEVTVYNDFDRAIDAYLPKTNIDRSSSLKTSCKQVGDAILIERAEENDALKNLMRLCVRQIGGLKVCLKDEAKYEGFSPNLLYRAAGSMLGIGLYDLGISLVDAAIKQDAYVVGYWSLKAQLITQIGSDTQLDECVDQGLRLDLNHPYLNYEKSRLLLRNNLTDDAFNHAEISIMSKDQDPRYWHQYALCLFAIGRMEDSLGACAVALKNSPEFIKPIRLYTQVLVSLGRYEDALSWLRQKSAKDRFNSQLNNLLSALENLELPDEVFLEV